MSVVLELWKFVTTKQAVETFLLHVFFESPTLSQVFPLLFRTKESIHSSSFKSFLSYVMSKCTDLSVTVFTALGAEDKADVKQYRTKGQKNEENNENN